MEISQHTIDSLIALSQEASKAIMAIYDANSTVVEYKADNSPLTQADKQSHSIIVNGLKKLFPDIPVISEEDSVHNKRLVNESLFWLVDPIDGTQEFVNRNGEFCIAIGLVENSKPIFGVVAAPTLNALYYGGPRVGSFKITQEREPESIKVKTLNPHVVAVSRSHLNEGISDYVNKHFPGSTQKPLGSMLKQMKLAEGEIDIYVSIDQPLNFWDVAAGNAIIEGAGGNMTKLDGSPLDYKEQDMKVGDFIARATTTI